MIRGRVIGRVWATRKCAGLVGRKLLLVAAERSQRVVVASDILDARVGDAVLVAWGSGARNVERAGPDNRAVLCDAAVAMIEDGANDGETPSTANPGQRNEPCSSPK